MNWKIFFSCFNKKKDSTPTPAISPVTTPPADAPERRSQPLYLSLLLIKT